MSPGGTSTSLRAAPLTPGAVPVQPPVAVIGQATRAGRFVLHLRNLVVGAEDVEVALLGGRLRVQASTSVDLPRLRLRQTLTAEYDQRLRPIWCIVRGTIDPRSLECDITFEQEQAVVRLVAPGRPVTRIVPLHLPPVLLVDNGFVTHALASLAASSPGAGGRFLALPAGEDLTVSPGRDPVLLGGEALPPPTLTLDLLPDLQEHVWITDSWTERMAIPQGHLRAEWRHPELERRQESDGTPPRAVAR